MTRRKKRFVDFADGGRDRNPRWSPDGKSYCVYSHAAGFGAEGWGVVAVEAGEAGEEAGNLGLFVRKQ